MRFASRAGLPSIIPELDSSLCELDSYQTHLLDMPPMPVFRYPPRDLPSPTPTATSPSDGHKPPNAGLIAGVVTASAIVLFLVVVILVPIFKRRRQRSAPAATSVEEFLGKDSTFERQAPGDIAAILDHLSYLPQNGAAPKSATPGRRSLVLLGRRLSGQPGSAQRPSSIVYNTQPPSGRGQQPQSGRNRDQTPRNQTGRSGRNRRPESIQQQKDWEDYYEEEKEAQHSVPNMRDSPPLDEYAPSPVRSPFMFAAELAIPTSVNIIVMQLHQLLNLITRKSLTMNISMVMVLPMYNGRRSPAGRAAPDSPDPYQHVPLTPRNVELPRTPRTPGSPLLREVLTPRTPYTPRTARRDISSPAMS
ncbi:hypothetical protein C8J56DRAFT_453822 [Mycena floridula]|nr:hypothetical protein C8J56DRAFT_453822 [Mycena floridula]